ncbi:DNA sulfur modification protein DndB [Cryobacterium aureum]|uniref:DNA sulfur modification protein DndB n=1 Tax=Cryobacterium aureum TaxID=995037 RepID=UPI0013750DBE|nr:DNA sulfur modification protein DndB [Cryobacterium aureum]
MIDPSLVTGYAPEITYFCTRYRQGGRTVFAFELSLYEIASLIPAPDPSKPTPGNREIRPKHADDFGKYIRNFEHWVAPSLILRAPAIFKFTLQAEAHGVEFGIISLPRVSAGDIHILDGQHRILGIHLANAGINEDMDKARDVLDIARRVEPAGRAVSDARARIELLESQRRRLEVERMSIQLFVEESTAEYRQMFYDIAENALGITASVKTRFDSRKVVNRTLDAVTSHPLLEGRVDAERDVVSRKGSPFLVGSKHVAEIIKVIAVGLDGRVSRRQEDELNEESLARNTRDFLDDLVSSFPDLMDVQEGELTPQDLRKTSLLGSIAVLKILGGVYYELLKRHAFDREMIREYFNLLALHMSGPVREGSVWITHTSAFPEGGMAPHGRRQDLAGLKEALTAWAVDRPAWLTGPGDILA